MYFYYKSIYRNEESCSFCVVFRYVPIEHVSNEFPNRYCITDICKVHKHTHPEVSHPFGDDSQLSFWMQDNEDGVETNQSIFQASMSVYVGVLWTEMCWKHCVN